MPPQDIPNLELSDDKLKEIIHWLDDEITNALLARETKQLLWLEIEEFYEKTTLDTKKDFPFPGAAYLMIALMPTYCEKIKAKIMNTVWNPRDPFSVRPTRKDFVEFVKPLRNFITWAVKNELDLEAATDDVILEGIKLGETVTKTIYTKMTEPAFEYNSDTEEFTEFSRVIKDQPEVIPIPRQDFLKPAETRVFEHAEWKAHRIRLSWNELLVREANGTYENVERLKAWEENRRTRYEEDRREVPDVTPIELVEYEIWECWFRYVIKEGQPPVKLVFWIHRDAKVSLKHQHNWYPLGLDPFDMFIYEKKPHRLEGVGVGQMALPFQKEISTMHNQALDSSTLRNAVMFKRKSDTTTADDVKVKMGGSIAVEEMDDLEIMFLGQQYDSTASDEERTLRLLQQRLGMEEFQEDGGDSPTQALAIRAERQRRFDLTLRRVRRFYSSIMIKCLLLYQKYYPQGKPATILGEDGQLIDVVWQFPPDWISEGMGIEVTATTSATSKELERQNKLSLFGLITQYYGQLTNYIMQAENPQLPVTVRVALLHIVDGLTTFILDILEDFELPHSAELVVAIDEIRQQTSETQSALQSQADAGQPGMAPTPSLPPGTAPLEGEGTPDSQQQS